LTYTGSSLTLVYVAQYNTGIATVSIDGSAVDQSACLEFRRVLLQSKTYTTTAGTHTVTVTVSGNKNAAASGTYIVFDAFIVANRSEERRVGKEQNTSSAPNFSSRWTSWADAGHSGGSVKYNNQSRSI